MAPSKSSTRSAGNGPRLSRKKRSRAEEDTADAALRRTGIRVMQEMPWGTHICVFYETKEDLLDTNVRYFEAGLRSNELCVWAISDPITTSDARDALRSGIPNLDRHLASGQIELLKGSEWYLEGDQFDLERVTGGWSAKLRDALAMGYDGIRIGGNAFWVATDYWKEFCEYEHALDRSLLGQKIVALCTYALHGTSAVDILDVARAHQYSIARRQGDWERLESPELRRANEEIRILSGALDILSKPFRGHKSLTPRERVTLAQIVRGASAKEAARALGVSPRTIEFHRANVMRKLGAKNAADLVRRVVGE